jgi:hypothetical protein
MPIPRVEIANWELWGMLVKSWATGANCFLVKPYSDKPAPPRPKNLAELVAQCAQFNVGITIPDRIKGLQFIQSNQETLMVRLPDAEMVRDSEATIHADPGSYPLPKFYGPGFHTPHLKANDQPFYDEKLKITKTNCMIFHACRIGDYTIGQCG